MRPARLPTTSSTKRTTAVAFSAVQKSAIESACGAASTIPSASADGTASPDDRLCSGPVAPMLRMRATSSPASPAACRKSS
eukprot:6259581-Prymnesium_polylepis.1